MVLQGKRGTRRGKGARAVRMRYSLALGREGDFLVLFVGGEGRRVRVCARVCERQSVYLFVCACVCVRQCVSVCVCARVQVCKRSVRSPQAYFTWRVYGRPEVPLSPCTSSCQSMAT